MKDLAGYTIIVFLLMIGGCFSEHEQEAAGQVQSLIHASGGKIALRKYGSTIKGNHTSIDLEFEGVDSAYLNESSTSEAAYLFYKLIPAKEFHFDQIQLTFIGNDYTFEKVYDVDSLRLIDEFWHGPIEGFFASRDLDSVTRFIDGSAIHDSLARLIFGQVHRADSACGQMTDLKMTGFEFRTAIDMNQRVASMSFNAHTATCVTEYTFMVSIATRKIIFIQVNDPVKTNS